MRIPMKKVAIKILSGLLRSVTNGHVIDQTIIDHTGKVSRRIIVEYKHEPI